MANIFRLNDILAERDDIRRRRAEAFLKRGQPGSLRERRKRAKHYRAKAEELRAIADDAILFETRRTLTGLADSYERMADTVDNPDYINRDKAGSAESRFGHCLSARR